MQLLRLLRTLWLLCVCQGLPHQGDLFLNHDAGLKKTPTLVINQSFISAISQFRVAPKGSYITIWANMTLFLWLLMAALQILFSPNYSIKPERWII